MRYIQSLSLLVVCACNSGSSVPADDGAVEPAQEPTSAEGDDATAAGPEEGQDADSWLREEARNLELAQQKQSFLVERHMATARDLIDRLRLEEAETELARALELDPDNLEAKRMLGEVGSLMGRSGDPANANVQRPMGRSVEEADVRLWLRRNARALVPLWPRRRAR